MQVTRKKLTGLVATTAVVALGAAGAFAYWSTSGSGSGSGTAADNVNATTVSVSVANNIVPGGTVAVTGIVANPNTTSSVYFNTIDDTSITASGDCNAADFSFAALTGLAKTLTPADGSATTNDEYGYTGALVMANTAVDQDACKGATITVNLTAS